MSSTFVGTPLPGRRLGVQERGDEGVRESARTVEGPQFLREFADALGDLAIAAGPGTRVRHLERVGQFHHHAPLLPPLDFIPEDPVHLGAGQRRFQREQREVDEVLVPRGRVPPVR
jgi:hypothetical protein